MPYIPSPMLTGLLFAAGVTACGERASTPLEPRAMPSAVRSQNSYPAVMRAVRQVTAGYHDVPRALADGYSIRA